MRDLPSPSKGKKKKKPKKKAKKKVKKKVGRPRKVVQRGRG